MKAVLSYREFSELRESYDPYINELPKFKVGQRVKIGDKFGQITSIGRDSYQVLIGSDQRRCKESELSPVTAKKQKDKGISREKKPLAKKII